MPSETILDPDRRVPSPILKHVRKILLGGKKVNSKESIEELRLAILNLDIWSLTQEKGTCCLLGCSVQHDHFLQNSHADKTIVNPNIIELSCMPSSIPNKI